MRRKLRILLITALVLPVVAAGVGLYLLTRENRPPLLAEAARCRLGAYQVEDGGLAYVRQRQGEELRLLFGDGRTTLLTPRQGGDYAAAGGGSASFDCASGRLVFDLPEGRGQATRIALRERPLEFESHGVRLRGKIVEPPGKTPPAVYTVLVHGSEHDSATFGNVWQYLLAARGFGAVVYDKRGTGLSEGKYTQDFFLLADDAAAAAVELRREIPGTYQVGFLGASQGGWVAPLAATKTPAGFVIALYGLAESALAEDRDEVLMGLREAGFGSPEVEKKALEVVAATGKVMASDYSAGWEELAAARRRYGDEAFFPHLRGEFTGDLVRYPKWALKLVGPLIDEGTSWEYEPLPTLEKIAIDHLWVLGGDDHQAPSARTRQLLLGLQPTHPRLDLAFFPRADHGILIYEPQVPGKPRSFHYAPGYFDLVLDWIATRRLPAGNAELVVASGAADLPAAAAASTGAPDV